MKLSYRMDYRVYTCLAHEHLLIAVFSGQVSLGDIRLFASDIQEFVGEKADAFVIILMRMPGQHPQSIRELIKIFQAVNHAMKRVCRFYTPHYNPLTSFLTNVVSKALGIHGKVIQRHSLEELLRQVEHDAEHYPQLKASMYDWETLKSKLLLHEPTNV